MNAISQLFIRVVIFLAVTTLTAKAEMPPEPPVEAVQACEGPTEGEACMFKAPDRTVVGTCRQLNTALACVPKEKPHRRPNPNQPGKMATDQWDMLEDQ